MENQIESTPPAWNIPTPLDDTVLPQFPLLCLPPVIRDYVYAVAESLQVPLDMAAMAALAVCAISVQGKYCICGKPDWYEPLNLYVVIVAPPAARKSTLLQKMTATLYDYESVYNHAHEDDIKHTEIKRNILIKTIKEQEDKAAKDGNAATQQTALDARDALDHLPEVKAICLAVDDATPEALVTLLAENNGKLAVISAEGGVFDALKGRYNQPGNIDTYLKGHSGDLIRIDRKCRPTEYIKSPALSILLQYSPLC